VLQPRKQMPRTSTSAVYHSHACGPRVISPPRDHHGSSGSIRSHTQPSGHDTTALLVPHILNGERPNHQPSNTGISNVILVKEFKAGQAPTARWLSWYHKSR